jgi:hypothetical protein
MLYYTSFIIVTVFHAIIKQLLSFLHEFFFRCLSKKIINSQNNIGHNNYSINVCTILVEIAGILFQKRIFLVLCIYCCKIVAKTRIECKIKCYYFSFYSLTNRELCSPYSILQCAQKISTIGITILFSMHSFGITLCNFMKEKVLDILFSWHIDFSGYLYVLDTSSIFLIEFCAILPVFMFLFISEIGDILSKCIDENRY